MIASAVAGTASTCQGGGIDYTVPNLFATAGLSCGYAAFDTVDPSAYDAPATFTGTIRSVILDIGGTMTANPAADMTQLMAQQ